MNTHYDTSNLKKVLLEGNITCKGFSKQVSELCGKPSPTVYSHIMGYGLPDNEEILAYSVILEKSEKDIKDMMYYNRIIPSAKSKVISNPSKSKYKKKYTNIKGNLILNIEVFETVRNNRSIKEIADITGIRQNYIYKWRSGYSASKHNAEIFSEKLGVKTSELFSKVRKTDTKKQVSPEKFDNTKLAPVEGIYNVFDVFRILNGNLNLIYNATLNNGNTKHIEIDEVLKSNKELVKKLEVLTKRMDTLEQSMNKVYKAFTEPVIPRDEREDKSLTKHINDKDIKYDPKDSLDVYSHKIDILVKKIANRDGLTMNQVRHNFYNIMNSTYGVVWEQLQKDYYRKHGKKNTWSLALLYDNGIFGQVFFNILKTESERSVSKK